MNAAVLLLIAAQLTVAGKPLKPTDFLDGRAIAGGTGTPLVLLTMTPRATTQVKRASANATVLLDGKTVVAHIVGNTIELEGQPNFDAAVKLARDLSGKPPLPDSLDE